jgi:hypothetical protein
MKKLIIKKNRGFTIVEALFAISILTFTITGLMTIVANSLFSARFAKDEITVNYLLQEAVDYIRNDRDTSMFLKGEDTNKFLEDYVNCGAPNGCYFDVPSMILDGGVSAYFCEEECNPFYYDQNKDPDDVGPFYISYIVDTDVTNMLKTNFRRKVIVTKEPTSNEIKIKVTVNWVNGGLPMERSLSTSLLNWRQ